MIGFLLLKRPKIERRMYRPAPQTGKVVEPCRTLEFYWETRITAPDLQKKKRWGIDLANAPAHYALLCAHIYTFAK